MHSFVPRPFPPPSLANVPVEYIIDQLHNLAPHYWSKPETADCSIIVPLDGVLRSTRHELRLSGSPSDPFSELGTPQNPVGHTRRVMEPKVRPAPRMVMKLHIDYLSAHSTLLRGLFSGASPVDLIPTSPCTTPRDSFFHLPIPPEPKHEVSVPSAMRGLPIAPLLPRMLPSSSTHPTIYLPVPDPSSLRLLIHYMYFGSTTFIEEALDEGTVAWEGLARNVEFLGMGMDIKVCLGRWYGRWRRGRSDLADTFSTYEYYGEDYSDDCSDSDSDDDSCFDSDEGEVMAPSSSATTASMDDDHMDIEDSLRAAKVDMSRGRQRTQRRLGHAISDPGPIRGRRSHDVPHTSHSSSPSRM
ncbi:uncharacterized protein PHACADRAFT_255788 [Phanerochaete carnosa HHB-10118-sp]|uniref:BTB domain-containing protein n=1 Tax=Phanerochaete carnosa (strain HHB-10118-sp) TaxID=650164 RepID=K5WXU0_PHACS|nr:uncharacterized protein PHACADRAFT_255788 [Phanerochaete carnosa HHB-10118-sp]EKM55287.1 hypothetical protein PHACADRAFT_255788 [Phanerochaete carnosa HHB-10118-sp]